MTAAARTVSPQSVLTKLLARSFGTAMRQALHDKVTRQFRISFLSEMRPLPENRVTLSPLKDDAGIPRPKIAFTVDDYTMKGFDKIAQVMKSVLTRLGSREEDMSLPTHDSSFMPAGHIMGTCRMGNDPGDSVVDRDCRSHDHPNMFIAGSSVFPTGGTANPTLTIAAISLRAAGTILKQLNHGIQI